MNDIKIGFIGVGNMGSALAVAVCKASGIQSILLSDKDENKVTAIAAKLGCEVSNNDVIASSCQYIFLGVKPDMITDLLRSLSGKLGARKDRFVLVSMAAGIEIDKIISCVGFDCPVIRIMPNTPVEVGEGMVLYATNSAVKEDEERVFLDFMLSSGKLDKLPENLIDAGSAISGCGPAFAYMFIESLADGGVKCGLSRNAALQYAEQMLIGASKLALISKRHPEELKDAVCSPGGSTIEGCYALERGAFRATVSEAVSSAFEKTKMFGK